jgi:glycosyltransferase involved in cell wall biosynthesis
MSVLDASVGLLDCAVRSILNQTYRDFEFLILDDGSSSAETRAYLDHLRDARLPDSRVRLSHEPHRGLTATLNLGLSLARGELIARQDADDWSDPTRLEKQVAFFAGHPEHVLIGSAAWTHQQDGKPLWPAVMPQLHHEVAAALWRGNPFFHGAAMFRRDAAQAVGGYREQLPCAQDYDFFWRLSETGGVANLPEPLYHYRYRAGSVSAERAAEQARAQRAARKLAEQRRSGERENVAQALLASSADASAAALKQADHLTLAGDYAGARRGYWEVLRSRPADPIAWGKLIRCGIFRTLPGLREWCFSLS